MKTTHSLKGMKHPRLLSTRRSLLATGVVSTACSGIGVLQGDFCGLGAGDLNPALQYAIRAEAPELAVS